jgi:hypothetical protein
MPDRAMPFELLCTRITRENQNNFKVANLTAFYVPYDLDAGRSSHSVRFPESTYQCRKAESVDCCGFATRRHYQYGHPQASGLPASLHVLGVCYVYICSTAGQGNLHGLSPAHWLH